MPHSLPHIEFCRISLFEYVVLPFIHGVTLVYSLEVESPNLKNATGLKKTTRMAEWVRSGVKCSDLKTHACPKGTLWNSSSWAVWRMWTQFCQTQVFSLKPSEAVGYNLTGLQIRNCDCPAFFFN